MSDNELDECAIPEDVLAGTARVLASHAAVGDFVQEMLVAFEEEGYCTDCWVDLKEESHDDKCGKAQGAFIPDDEGGTT